MAGFVLKSHYGSTAERASVVRAAVPGVQTLGAIALNRAVGGINPLAVEIAAREGARTVWMPTVDAVNEAHEREAPPGAKVPVWVKLQLELREQGIEIEPVPVVDADGTRAARDARGARDGRAPRDAARHRPPRARRDLRGRRRGARAGRRARSSSRTPTSRRRTCRSRTSCALAERGALLERCFTTPHTGKMHLGAVDRGHPRDRRRELGPLDRPRPGVQPAGRGRDGA